MQAQNTVERKYALKKIAPGDYLLPANDGLTIWRIAKYEDGPSHGVEDMPADREFWGLWRWQKDGISQYVDTGSWDRWEMVDGGNETRADAIREALRIA